MSHAGRIGNVVTLNGQLPETWQVRAGERLRLLLINTANARHCALRFEGHEPLIIAIDGQPVEPHAPEGGTVILAAAMRVDLLLDLSNEPGSRFRVIDEFYPRFAYRLIDLLYTEESRIGVAAHSARVRLPPNPVPEPDMAAARRHEIVFTGGAMGGLRGAKLDGVWSDIRSLAAKDVFWVVNGVARQAGDFDAEPVLTLERNASYVLAMRNDTAFPHPIHLHGYSFRVLSRDGMPITHRPWQDTVLMQPEERVEIAFKADNPGDWLFHCHVLEHMTSGMTGVIRVA